MTHVDAHADLGLGDAGYLCLMTELLFVPPAERVSPKTGPEGLNDGNWLSFAIACHWVTELVYVLNTGGPPIDLMPHIVEGWFSTLDKEPGFTSDTRNIELPAIDVTQVDNLGGQTRRGRSFRAEGPVQLGALEVL